MEYNKVKSVPKLITTKGPQLQKVISETTRTIRDIVGSTLGPGGTPVLIERFEHDLPPLITKDGVTVFRSLGFQDAGAQVIMEAMRDCATRTGRDAGDGTTTATILAEAIGRLIAEYCATHINARPQRIMRSLMAAFRDVVEPTLRASAIKVDSSTEKGQDLLTKVAQISGNRDAELAAAVMKCFEVVGDSGNVTIVEQGGESRYEVEEMQGYPIPVGYDEACLRYASMFINEPGAQRVRMDNPVFVLYNGQVNDVTTAMAALEQAGRAVQAYVAGNGTWNHPNVVFVATSFSESVLAMFGAGWAHEAALHPFPLPIPRTPFQAGHTNFLEDMAAITGAKVFDPISRPLENIKLEDMGPGLTMFEVRQWRSMVIGSAAEEGGEYEDALLDQTHVIEQQLGDAQSDAEKYYLQERLGKLTGGIAKLIVRGSSNGELKEKSARADDAVCAVRGAINHGCLPGGGWGLLRACQALLDSNPSEEVREILAPALVEPVMQLLNNCGYSDSEINGIIGPIQAAMNDGNVLVYDAMDERHGEPVELGVLDSVPAVIEACRNALSIAAVLGTTNGMVVFGRDRDLERSEAEATQAWGRAVNINEADERA